MFKFFQKRREQREAAEAKASAFKQVLSQLENGNGNVLEAALVVALADDGNKDSLNQFLLRFGGSDVWILNKSGDRPGDPAVTEGSDGNPYVAIFSSPERAAAAQTEWGIANHPMMVSVLELLLPLDASVGMVLNANDLHLHWNFTPGNVANLRMLYVKTYNYRAGGIYSVWAKGSYRAVKMLEADEGGVHIRLYANAWPERPESISPETLTLAQADPNDARAVGHLPMTRGCFLTMGPRHVVEAPVTDEDLDGYRIWMEQKGGYFGS